MESGPSKEQLESLFKTSRKYFDEMAKEYYAKDRDFYNKNFAPFYSNPLLVTRKGNSPVKIVVAVGLFTLIMSFAVAMLLFFNHEHTDNIPVRQSEKIQDPVEKKADKPATSVKDSVDKDNINLENLQKELKQKDNEVKENNSKREVKSKPIERQR
jgi:hypothetical protein